MWRAASVSFITITTSTGPTDKPTPDGGDQTFHHGRHAREMAPGFVSVASGLSDAFWWLAATRLTTNASKTRQRGLCGTG
jgi:hypothetical protein